MDVQAGVRPEWSRCAMDGGSLPTLSDPLIRLLRSHLLPKEKGLFKLRQRRFLSDLLDLCG
ncbi:MAG: hypothetical protein DHS20C11_07230 [Lysobacteraceae bacterium]|nr:MAG: hypothetical protein DHS20C11_07230 [Xanthomonadaceae bacterium]